jgi:hypothetical protein
MRLQRERPPDAMHRRDRSARRLGHRAGAPMRGGGGHLLKRCRDHRGDLRIADRALGARAGSSSRSVQARHREPLAPCRDRRSGDAKPLRDRQVGHAAGREQHDRGARRVAPAVFFAVAPALRVRHAHHHPVQCRPPCVPPLSCPSRHRQDERIAPPQNRLENFCNRTLAGCCPARGTMAPHRRGAVALLRRLADDARGRSVPGARCEAVVIARRARRTRPVQPVARFLGLSVAA